MSIPLAILSDSAAGQTGLGRVSRELALRIHAELSDVFRVAVFGIGGNYSSRLPFPNYPIRNLQAMVPLDLPELWADFAGKEKGILFSILNISWCGWLAQPERLPPGLPLRDFLGSGSAKPDAIPFDKWAQLSPNMQKILGKQDSAPFKKWLYCPVDGDVDGTLGKECEPILKGFDRVLSYTRYGSKVIADTMGVPIETIPDLPHGCDTSVFYPRDRKLARDTFVSRLSNGASTMPIRDDVVLLGAVATNTFRKDWGLAFETCKALLDRGKNVFLWAHTNSLGADGNANTHWNIMALAQQFGMGQRVILTTDKLSDDDMAWCLSALDVNLGLGSGEGWGMGNSDSLAVGVPVVHGNYAGSTDFIPKEFLVDSPAHRLEGKWMIRRPSFRASEWADKVEFCLTPEAKALAVLPEYIDWTNAWPAWKSWLLDGIQAPS